jgi:predicted esterase
MVRKPASLYTFRRGTTADSPILLPLARENGDMRAMIRFCRAICPGAPMLIPDINRILERSWSEHLVSGGMLAHRLATLIDCAVQVHGLSLIPIIAVGHAEGADLGANLMLTHTSLLGAGILLRPGARITPAAPGALEGIHVLLARSAGEEAVGTAGRQVGDMMKKAGATVICERVLHHRTPGTRDAAIARVFIAALFGA